ncbi:hypothetical protein X474_19090 [Dethiosulfatarculus sandiegensis]|uniref:Uncharacterized protein n=1 Tax=Dethiosulfatarculus sandiegensis TaxID=1429043 RepID=A0A0D2J2L5_9BACT|nr:hypothetical protein X474_19090 [Dethiosulfatarculus sandiegensis]
MLYKKRPSAFVHGPTPKKKKLQFSGNYKKKFQIRLMYLILAAAPGTPLQAN